MTKAGLKVCATCGHGKESHWDAFCGTESVVYRDFCEECPHETDYHGYAERKEKP